MSVSQVRLIIADPFQFDRATATGNGTATLFELPHGPVSPGSEAITVDGTSQTDPTDYSLDDALGLVTFVTAPTNGATIAFTYQHSLLSDADLTTFLTLESNNVKRASAAALETIARSRALIEKKITLGDLQVDGTALAQELRMSAKQLRDEDKANSDDGAFAIAEMVTGPLSRREYLEKLAIDESN